MILINGFRIRICPQHVSVWCLFLFALLSVLSICWCGFCYLFPICSSVLANLSAFFSLFQAAVCCSEEFRAKMTSGGHALASLIIPVARFPHLISLNNWFFLLCGHDVEMLRRLPSFELVVRAPRSIYIIICFVCFHRWLIIKMKPTPNSSAGNYIKCHFIVILCGMCLALFVFNAYTRHQNRCWAH